jgi:hypothetical protein
MVLIWYVEAGVVDVPFMFSGISTIMDMIYDWTTSLPGQQLMDLSYQILLFQL